MSSNPFNAPWKQYLRAYSADLERRFIPVCQKCVVVYGDNGQDYYQGEYNGQNEEVV